MLMVISDLVQVEYEDNLMPTGPLDYLDGNSNPNSYDITYYFRPVTPAYVIIKGESFRIIPFGELIRQYQNEDGYYRLIYIQINMSTNEYYVGKVNRPSWREVKRYQGSGLKFKRKYDKHQKDFTRYYISACSSAQETEELEARIVDNELLSDVHCLNLVCGGGGTNAHPTSEETSRQRREYMKQHPNQYKAMVERSKELYTTPDSPALRERSLKIKGTMSTPQYREMVSKRIKNWKMNNPDDYQKARAHNREAQNNQITKEKRVNSLNRWKEMHPEEYAQNEAKRLEACQSNGAKQKRSLSIKQWNALHPEEARKNKERRSEASTKVTSKKVNMLDLETGKILRQFDSQHDAARWLVDQKLAKNTNCVSSISTVCLKSKCTTGYGYRKKAYGYGWEFDAEEN